ncbi:MAG: hypothetical protein HUJ58_08055, partial [Erysipelotrichaceae bacterium]|nr:hypothetical protein [Erysipelotrichaceae bacterium]
MEDTVITTSKNEMWRMLQNTEGYYYFQKKENGVWRYVSSKNGWKFETSYIDLANRLFVDFQRYGKYENDNYNPFSIVLWHNMLLDIYSSATRDIMEKVT